MPVTYFVAIKPQSNEYHTVHKDGCPFMPDDGKRIILGQFKSVFDALNAGKRHYMRSESCRFCSKEHHSEIDDLNYLEVFMHVSQLTPGSFFNTWDSALQCCIN